MDRRKKKDQQWRVENTDKLRASKDRDNSVTEMSKPPKHQPPASWKPELVGDDRKKGWAHAAGVGKTLKENTDARARVLHAETLRVTGLKDKNDSFHIQSNQIYTQHIFLSHLTACVERCKNERNIYTTRDLVSPIQRDNARLQMAKSRWYKRRWNRQTP